LNPKISIILPAYNADKYIGLAIESILKQTFINFELIIINDGSTDNTKHIITEYQKKDDRIKYFEQENLGLTKTLNKGISVSKANLIARMDADDIAMKQRLEIEYNILKKNENVVLVSSDVIYIDEKGSKSGRSYSPSWQISIRKKLRRGNIIFHPTVMFRKTSVIKAGGYNEDVLHYIEDYLLWTELLKQGDFHIESTPLLYYRISESSISHSVNRSQKKDLLLKHNLPTKVSKINPTVKRAVESFFLNRKIILFLKNIEALR